MKIKLLFHKQRTWSISFLRKRPHVTLLWTTLRWWQHWYELWVTQTILRPLAVLQVHSIIFHIIDKVCLQSSNLEASLLWLNYSGKRRYITGCKNIRRHNIKSILIIFLKWMLFFIYNMLLTLHRIEFCQIL